MGIIGDILRVNSQPYSWNSSLSRFDGLPWPGMQSIDYSEKLDVETVYSQTQDGKPIGATAGQYEVDSFTLKMLRDSADALTTYLSAKPPFIGSYGRTEFSFQLSVSEPLLPGGTPIMLIAGTCRIVSAKETTEVGTGRLLTEFGVWCQGIIKNGKTLYTTAIPGIGAI